MRWGTLLLITVLGTTACGSAGTPSSRPRVPRNEVAPLTQIELTDHYDCGYGFYVGNADQTVALMITYTDFPTAEQGEIPPTGELGVDWNAELQMGTDLFANWCDDVLEPGEPTPDVREVWPVSGRIDVTRMPQAGGWGLAEAVLTDLVVHQPDGVDVTLGDIPVSNEHWGIIPG